MRKTEDMGWVIPALAVLLPVGLLLIGCVLNLLGLNGRLVLPAFWITFLLAPFVGVLTLMILFVQKNLNREGLRRKALLRVAVMGAAAAVSPVWLVLLKLILITPES